MDTARLLDHPTAAGRHERPAVERVEPKTLDGAEILIDLPLSMGVDTVFACPGGAIHPALGASSRIRVS